MQIRRFGRRFLFGRQLEDENDAKSSLLPPQSAGSIDPGFDDMDGDEHEWAQRVRRWSGLEQAERLDTDSQ